MDEIARRKQERRRGLAEQLEPIFEEDAANAAVILVTALDYEFGNPIKEADRQRYLEALEALPRNSKAKPHLAFASSYGAQSELHWRVTLTDGNAEYESRRPFRTEEEAYAYVTEFRLRLAEIARP